MFDDIPSSIDVRLLQVTQVLLREQSVSRVAEQLGLSQPAVSATLKRARAIFGDPLLVRSGQRLVLTERGQKVQTSIQDVLAGLQAAISHEAAFDPAQATGTIRIGASNCFCGFLLPALAAAIRREAPGMRVHFFAPHDVEDVAEELADSRADLVLGTWPSPRESLRSSTLLTCDIACLMHHSHPLARKSARMTLEDYLAAEHVSPTALSKAIYSPIDGQLAVMGARRNVVMTIPEYGMIPTLLCETDLIFTTARPFTEHIANSPGFSDLVCADGPKELASMKLYSLWHERAQTCTKNQWLRGVVRRLVSRFDKQIDVLPKAQSESIVHFLAS